MADISSLTDKLDELSSELLGLKEQSAIIEQQMHQTGHVDPFIFALTVFVLACFVGYYVVWKVTPALHTPLMSVTNAISGIIIVGAMIAVGASADGVSQTAGFIAVVLASVNIFGGFIVTRRMLEMYRKKEPK